MCLTILESLYCAKNIQPAIVVWRLDVFIICNCLDTEALLAKVEEYKKELFGLRFQQATGQLENTARIKEVRKSIARIKTVLREQAK